MQWNTEHDAGDAEYRDPPPDFLDTAIPIPDDAMSEPDLEIDMPTKPEIPMAYAEQVVIEPVAYGTWHQQPAQLAPPPPANFLDQDDNKDLISFIFVLVLGLVCVAILFYPFSYYDDDFYDKPHKP